MQSQTQRPAAPAVLADLGDLSAAIRELQQVRRTPRPLPVLVQTTPLSLSPRGGGFRSPSLQRHGMASSTEQEEEEEESSFPELLLRAEADGGSVDLYSLVESRAPPVSLSLSPSAPPASPFGGADGKDGVIDGGGTDGVQLLQRENDALLSFLEASEKDKRRADRRGAQLEALLSGILQKRRAQIEGTRKTRLFWKLIADASSSHSQPQLQGDVQTPEALGGAYRKGKGGGVNEKARGRGVFSDKEAEETAETCALIVQMEQRRRSHRLQREREWRQRGGKRGRSWSPAPPGSGTFLASGKRQTGQKTMRRTGGQDGRGRADSSTVRPQGGDLQRRVVLEAQRPDVDGGRRAVGGRSPSLETSLRKWLDTRMEREGGRAGKTRDRTGSSICLYRERGRIGSLETEKRRAEVGWCLMRIIRLERELAKMKSRSRQRELYCEKVEGKLLAALSAGGTSKGGVSLTDRLRVPSHSLPIQEKEKRGGGARRVRQQESEAGSYSVEHLRRQARQGVPLGPRLLSAQDRTESTERRTAAGGRINDHQQKQRPVQRSSFREDDAERHRRRPQRVPSRKETSGEEKEDHTTAAAAEEEDIDAPPRRRIRGTRSHQTTVTLDRSTRTHPALDLWREVERSYAARGPSSTPHTHTHTATASPAVFYSHSAKAGEKDTWRPRPILGGNNSEEQPHSEVHRNRGGNFDSPLAGTVPGGESGSAPGSSHPNGVEGPVVVLRDPSQGLKKEGDGEGRWAVADVPVGLQLQSHDVPQRERGTGCAEEGLGREGGGEREGFLMSDFPNRIILGRGGASCPHDLPSSHAERTATTPTFGRGGAGGGGAQSSCRLSWHPEAQGENSKGALSLGLVEAQDRSLTLSREGENVQTSGGAASSSHPREEVQTEETSERKVPDSRLHLLSSVSPSGDGLDPPPLLLGDTQPVPPLSPQSDDQPEASFSNFPPHPPLAASLPSGGAVEQNLSDAPFAPFDRPVPEGLYGALLGQQRGREREKEKKQERHPVDPTGISSLEEKEGERRLNISAWSQGVLRGLLGSPSTPQNEEKTAGEEKTKESAPSASDPQSSVAPLRPIQSARTGAEKREKGQNADPQTTKEDAPLEQSFSKPAPRRELTKAISALAQSVDVSDPSALRFSASRRPPRLPSASSSLSLSISSSVKKEKDNLPPPDDSHPIPWGRNSLADAKPQRGGDLPLQSSEHHIQSASFTDCTQSAAPIQLSWLQPDVGNSPLPTRTGQREHSSEETLKGKETSQCKWGEDPRASSETEKGTAHLRRRPYGGGKEGGGIAGGLSSLSPSSSHAHDGAVTLGGIVLTGGRGLPDPSSNACKTHPSARATAAPLPPLSAEDGECPPSPLRDTSRVVVECDGNRKEGGGMSLGEDEYSNQSLSMEGSLSLSPQREWRGARSSEVVHEKLEKVEGSVAGSVSDSPSLLEELEACCAHLSPLLGDDAKDGDALSKEGVLLDCDVDDSSLEAAAALAERLGRAPISRLLRSLKRGEEDPRSQGGEEGPCEVPLAEQSASAAERERLGFPLDSILEMPQRERGEKDSRGVCVNDGEGILPVNCQGKSVEGDGKRQEVSLKSSTRKVANPRKGGEVEFQEEQTAVPELLQRPPESPSPSSTEPSCIGSASAAAALPFASADRCRDPTEPTRQPQPDGSRQRAVFQSQSPSSRQTGSAGSPFGPHLAATCCSPVGFPHLGRENMTESLQSGATRQPVCGCTAPHPGVHRGDCTSVPSSSLDSNSWSFH
uniref:Uncharacterized protein n=1 Tax=Chromera velia CCMP2878 TaxID=1169474 RepID=A0A0G4IFJ0_9ALVE|eukprot:Cvel_14000.t1-p1 / transcript=Cvel_14000.t1 / gene=Cvel_14000 / organism=Chromera_velia_CCMP2878 / gene_product=hypothetical protein / transcript_product=hypothetical protein / location=Cvel_scaffold979:30048-38234(+) / protein_length=1750 / sequence_SO=supercontig / SO=protein_coding / is_pseudo=false